MVTMTPERENQLLAVQAGVNDGTTYTTDQVEYGVPEYWTEIGIDHRADCEDYALTKMAKLRELGWPREDLNIAVCLDHGAGHAVLVVTTDRGDIVLDNKQELPQPWNDLDYKWLEVSVGGSFRTWRAIGGTA